MPRSSTTQTSPRSGPYLPDGPSAPFLLRVALATLGRGNAMSLDDRRRQYGPDFTLKLPLFGRSLIVSEPAEVRQIFKADPAELGNMDPNLGRVMGSGSLFNLSGDPHRSQRKLLTPAFHGNRLAAYRTLMQDEARRGMADWPVDRPVASLPAMNAITLNIILRTVFGAEGADLDVLRDLLPRMVRLGSILAATPIPAWDGFGYAPWGRFRRMRAEYDAIVGRLIARGRNDEHGAAARSDILSMLIGATYDDGNPMTDDEIADELVTLLTAGHETTATTLAWAVERMRRHPDVLAALVTAVDADDDEYLDAFINEVQRTRPVIAMTLRRVEVDDYVLGPWRVPRGMHIMVGISLLHTDGRVFPEPWRFDPERFRGVRPDPYQLIPFGGGVRRCIGAAFAHMELRIVLKTLLAEHVIEPTHARGEPWHSRGVAFAPGHGGRIVRRPRERQTTPAAA
ncbi:cytochrome P450 [Salinisphaera sp. Q1T1-3]|uniref:cytochrome P450 n=1 Tax=Salinisphaera sp. Q1T1-3 TaxID=2321229 RepID=UPI000E724D77|nr:cytochrome P450 [Salinisphaera sp. Q1T1-3]RJS91426.1 cytochrome P450 [Salinisphaera sp. Q1T1-3]